MDHDDRDKFLGISYSIAKGERFKSRSVLLSWGVPSTEMDEDQREFIETLAQFFHNLLISHDASSTVDSRPCYPLIEANDWDLQTKERALFNYAMEDTSVLRRLVHALSYGERLQHFPIKSGGGDGDDDDDSSDDDDDDDDGGSYGSEDSYDVPAWRRLALKTFAVTDIIRTVRSKYRGLIKTTVDELLPAGSNENSPLQFFLGRIGISSCRNDRPALDFFRPNRTINGTAAVAAPADTNGNNNNNADDFDYDSMLADLESIKQHATRS